METKKVIETNVKDLKLSHLDENDNFFEFENYSDLDDIDEKDKLKVLFETVQLTLGLLVENIKEDLKDIWERLDEIENNKEA